MIWIIIGMVVFCIIVGLPDNPQPKPPCAKRWPDNTGWYLIKKDADGFQTVAHLQKFKHAIDARCFAAVNNIDAYPMFWAGSHWAS